MATSLARWPKGLQEPDIAVLRAVVDASPSRVSLVTPEHRYLYANPEFCASSDPARCADRPKRARGARPGSLRGLRGNRRASDADECAELGRLDHLLGRPKRYLEVTMAPYAPHGGAIEALFVFARDLTELKSREQELATSLGELARAETLHKAVVASSLGCIVVMDDQGIVVEFNPAAERTFGWSRDEAIGRSIVELIVPPSVRTPNASNADVFRQLMERDSIGVALKRETVRKDGSIAIMEMSITRFLMNARELFMVHCRDLSADIQRQQELVSSEAARLASEQINTQIVKSALDAFVLADGDGKIRDFNPAAEEMLGHRRDEAIGRSLSEVLIPHHHRAAHEAGMSRYMATGVSRVMGKRMQLEALSASGELIPVEVTINEVKLPEKHLFTAHMRDLRESRKAQAEIEAQRARIHQIEKLSAMGSLLAGVAHELNNPLAILVAQSTLLREKAATDDVRQRADRIHAAADRAGRIVKSFLAMAREKPPAREMTDVNRLIGETLEMLGYGLRTAGIEVVRDLDRTTPELKIDADMFRQVVANIVLNSQQVLMTAPKPRILTLRTEAGPTHVAIEIGDNGPGIAPDVASRIFDPFFTTKPAGVGRASASRSARTSCRPMAASSNSSSTTDRERFSA